MPPPLPSRSYPPFFRSPFIPIALVAVACGDPAPDPATENEPADVGTEPVVFAPGVISDDREQYRLTFTPSGDTAYFGAGDGFFPMTRQATIYRSVRGDDGWGVPEAAPFSGTFPDLDPFVSPDGRRLYFSSIRPVDGEARDDVTLWVVERQGEGWSEPRHVGVATDFDDLYPSVDAAGNLYFATPRPRPDLPDSWNIHVAVREEGPPDAPARFGEPTPLGDGVNGAETWEFNPAVSADGSCSRGSIPVTPWPPASATFTWASSATAGGPPPGGGWTPSRNLGHPMNTPLDEYHPSFSPDGRTLYFVRRDPAAPDANGDLYRVPVEALGGVLTAPGS